jgi:methylated-DNA-[protein]-cysteine S-methyltransferase
MMSQQESPQAYTAVIDSPLGRLGIVTRDTRLCRLDYIADAQRPKAATTAFARQVARQLAQYFSDPGYTFTLALDLQGSVFQCRVWEALTQIAAGQTVTYGELAARLGSGARAVGNACRHNPVPVIVPCHRIIGTAGIGGYSGSRDGREIQRKRWLLNHEGVAGTGLKIGRKSPCNELHSGKQRNLHA